MKKLNNFEGENSSAFISEDIVKRNVIDDYSSVFIKNTLYLKRLK